ncbi:prostaglandin E2 receptor EP4 subtype-like [Dreissena polymorpha]|uniref:prostaglandin E2 receptor EP4 subtype-like n=1 Tax=Dreissena polymorpha TaxID=45954 RepID=UPI002264AE60|nr:prostaglandin E2 receptor EP4 subtype-like [Dreissena polymorpha]
MLGKISAIKKQNSVVGSSIMFSMGVFGNVLALIVLQRSPGDQKRKLFYRLVAGLTITDLVGTTSLSPLVIATYVNHLKWIGGIHVCKYFGFMMVFSGVATSTIVCLMAIERLISIRHPYLYYARIRKKHANYFLLSAWTFAASVASLPLIGFGEIVLQYPYTWCFIDYYTDNKTDRGYNCLFAFLELLMITVTVTCNCIVLYTLLLTKMRGLSGRKNSFTDSRTFSGYSRRYAECQMAVLLIGITVVFSSCYLPLIIRILLNQTKLFPVDMRSDLLTIRFASLNQILDPWVYILVRREIVSRLIITIRKIISPKATEVQIRTFLRQDSAHSAKDSTYTCCTFCFHCLCDPSQQRRADSVSGNHGSNYIAFPMSPRLPTNKHAIGVIRNVMLPNTSIDSPAVLGLLAKGYLVIPQHKHLHWHNAREIT